MESFQPLRLGVLSAAGVRFTVRDDGDGMHRPWTRRILSLPAQRRHRSRIRPGGRSLDRVRARSRSPPPLLLLPSLQERHPALGEGDRALLLNDSSRPRGASCDKSSSNKSTAGVWVNVAGSVEEASRARSCLRMIGSAAHFFLPPPGQERSLARLAGSGDRPTRAARESCSVKQ